MKSISSRFLSILAVSILIGSPAILSAAILVMSPNIDAYINSQNTLNNSTDLVPDREEFQLDRSNQRLLRDRMISGFNSRTINTNRSSFLTSRVISARGGRLEAGWNTDSTSGTETQTTSGIVNLNNTPNIFSGDISFDGADTRISVTSLESGNYTGTIEGIGTLDFTNTSTQIFAPSSTISYTGSTTITSGTLLVNDTLSSSGIVGNTNFGASGQLDVSDGSLTMVDGGTLSFDSFGFDDLIGNTYVIDGGETYDFINGDLTTHFGEVNAYDLSDGHQVFFREGSFAYQVVPEPSASILGSLSLLTLLRRRRA